MESIKEREVLLLRPHKDQLCLVCDRLPFKAADPESVLDLPSLRRPTRGVEV